MNEAKGVVLEAKPDKPCKGQAGFLILGGVLVMAGIWLNELQDERRATREMEQFTRWYVSLPHCKEEVKPVPQPWPKKPTGAPIGSPVVEE